ncbi:MAG TPA: hypothetical protein VFF02_03965 [Anaeromyxobacteraceae bacterium]|nr:hypothetical protein [Anaeromyxobacteraceae bacterium]
MRHALAMAAVAAAACTGSSAPGGSTGGLPQVACTASPPLAPVGTPVVVRCTASPGAAGPAWAVEPPGASLLPQAGNEATLTVHAGSVGPSFGDTVFLVRAAYRNAAGEGTGAAAVTMLGNTWIARSGAAAVLAVASDGTPLAAPLALQGTPGPVLAMAGRADGAVLVAQNPQAGPPVRVHDRSGVALGSFDAADAGGAALFDAAAPPRAIQQMRDGTVWVTGGTRPVIYEPGGRFRGRAAEAPAETMGLTQLPDGRVAVTYRYAWGIGFYDEAGATLTKKAIAATAPSGESYGAAGALLALADGHLLLAAAHFAPAGWTGTLLRLDPELRLDAELAASARVPRNVPRALSLAGSALDAAPSPAGGDTAATCPRRFAADLSGSAGCLDASTDFLGVAHLGPALAGPARPP